MTNPPDFDIFPNLDREIDAAVQANADSGGLAKTVHEELGDPEAQPQRRLILDSERVKTLEGWALPELRTALQSWDKYHIDLMSRAAPHVMNFSASHPNFHRTLDMLYRAKEHLTAGGEKTPDGANVGDTMHMVLIPWQDFRDRVPNDLEPWLAKLRDVQHRNAEEIPQPLKAFLTLNMPLYRDPDDPTKRLKPTEYLDKKIAQDGPWGIMLMQTDGHAGSSNYLGRSARSITHDGESKTGDATPDGTNFSSSDMGVFEWWAMTLQDPDKISTDDHSLLLANQLDDEGIPAPLVVTAKWHTWTPSFTMQETQTASMSLNMRLCVGSPQNPGLPTGWSWSGSQ